MRTRARGTKRRLWRSSSLAVLGLAAVGCGGASHGARRLEIADPATHWADGGFVEMVPPIHMPSPDADRDAVEVWVAARELGVIPGARPLLAFTGPVIADRLEFTGAGPERRIVDVRGTEIDAAGRCMHHVLRPRHAGVDAPLVGMQWPCDDPEAQREADAQMEALLVELPPFAGMPAAAQRRALDGFRERNACDGCHVENRADAEIIGQYGAVHRGTDATGFFAPQAVLRDELPLERYGAFDRNVDDPAISVRCAEGEPTRVEVRHGAWRWQCGGDLVPHARVDWAALAAHDPERAQRVCASRRALERWLGDDASAFADALAPCRAIALAHVVEKNSGSP